MATSDVMQVVFIEVCVDPSRFIVRVAGADTQLFLVADRMSVVQSDALRPVETNLVVDAGGQPAALRHSTVHGVLEPATSIREPVRYLKSRCQRYVPNVSIQPWAVGH